MSVGPPRGTQMGFRLQQFCAQNPGDAACTNDGGPTWANPSVGTAATSDDVQVSPPAQLSASRGN